MVELEIAFCNLKDLMKIIEQMFKTIIQKTMNKCHAEFNYLVKKHKKHASNFTKNDYFKIYKITL